MPKFKIQADDPDTRLFMVVNGTPYIISRNGNASWEMHDHERIRLGAKSLHWTTALRRAIEHIEGE